MLRAVICFCFMLLICIVVAPTAVNANNKFPSSDCSSHPLLQNDKISCKFLGRADGIPAYALIYGRSKQFLFQFSRSAEVLRNNNSSALAINSYEGSNYTDCYLFPNAENHKKMIMLSRIWKEKILKSKDDIINSILDSDHTYYTCSKFLDKSIEVSARWRRNDGSYLVGVAQLLLSGRLINLKYHVDTGNL